MLLGGAFRGVARCVTRRRAPRALLTTGRAVLKSKRVCARGPRGRPRVVGWTKNEYCPALYVGNAASLRERGRGKPESCLASGSHATISDLRGACSVHRSVRRKPLLRRRLRPVVLYPSADPQCGSQRGAHLPRCTCDARRVTRSQQCVTPLASPVPRRQAQQHQEWQG